MLLLIPLIFLIIILPSYLATIITSFNNTLTIENLTYNSGGGNFIRYFNMSYDDFVKSARIDLTPYNASDYQNFTCNNCGNSTLTFNTARLNQYINNSYIITLLNGSGFQSGVKLFIMRVDNNFTRISNLLRLTSTGGTDILNLDSFIDNDGDVWNIRLDSGGQNFLTEFIGWSDTTKKETSYAIQDIYKINSVSYNSIDNTIMALTQTATNNNHYIHLLNGSGTIISNCSIGSGILCSGIDSCILPQLRYDALNNKTYAWNNVYDDNNNMSIYEIDMHASGSQCEFKNEITPNEFPTKYSNVNQGSRYGYVYNNNTNSFILMFPNSTADNLVFAVRNHSSPSSFKIDSGNEGGNDVINTPLTTFQNNIDFNATAMNQWLRTNCASGQCYVPINFSSLSHGIVQISDINLTINDRPSVSSVNVINSTGGNYIDTNTDANCSFITSDNDNSTFTNFFKWFKDGTGNLNFNVQILAKGNYSSGNKINCSIFVSKEIF